jgi:hypothetical protein
MRRLNARMTADGTRGRGPRRPMRPLVAALLAALALACWAPTGQSVAADRGNTHACPVAPRHPC